MKFKLTEVKHKLWPINNKVIIINQNNNLTDNGNFMVSFMLNVVKFLLIYRHLQNIYWFILVLQWNDLTKQPEIIEAVKRVEERKEQETEAKREEQARQERYQGVLDRFISEGNEQLKNFSQSSRIDFDEKEAKAIIMFDILFTHTFVTCVKISAKTKNFSLLVAFLVNFM